MPPPLGNVLCEFDQRENGPRQFMIHLDEPNRLEYRPDSCRPIAPFGSVIDQSMLPRTPQALLRACRCARPDPPAG